MLQLFRRPDDPEEYFAYYLLPVALLCGGVATGAYFNLAQVRERERGGVWREMGGRGGVCCV